jgi:hypothetical protein
MSQAAVNDLRSADPKLIWNAAVYLGGRKIKAAVPALLEVLQSPHTLGTSEHVTTGGMRRWILIDPKARIVEALGAIGDKRAVPLLERYLRAPPPSLGVAPGDLRVHCFSSPAFGIDTTTAKAIQSATRRANLRKKRFEGGFVST